MKKWIITITLILLIVIISNIAPVRYLVSYVLDEKHYCYSNYSGSFTMMDRQDFKSGAAKAAFKDCSAITASTSGLDKRDKILYRLFWRNPFCFWRWYDYFKNPSYKLPYLSWDEVQKRRGDNYIKGNPCQDF